MGSSKQVVQRERRAFCAEFKAEAVRMVAERRADGASLTQIGRELEVRPDQLRAWTRVQREASGEGSAPPGETLEPRESAAPTRGGDPTPRAGLRKKRGGGFNR